ncbi:MAG: YceI family protein [Burkholderiaceae bacterium]
MTLFKLNNSSLFAAILAGLMWAVTPTHAAPLAVDQTASEVSVTFTQMNVPVDASFTEFSADATFDPASPETASAKITIKTASFDFGPGAEEYNAEVRKPEWFDSKQFPDAVFEANGAKPGSDQQYEVAGQLTIKGKTVDVVAPVVLSEVSGQWVFMGELPIKRLDYGLGATEWSDTSIVADEVIVKFKIVAAKP